MAPAVGTTSVLVRTESDNEVAVLAGCTASTKTAVGGVPSSYKRLCQRRRPDKRLIGLPSPVKSAAAGAAETVTAAARAATKMILNIAKKCFELCE